MTITTQVKNGLYYNQFSMDIFFLLTVEVFECLHQKTDKFFHQCVNMVLGAKGIASLPFLILRTFYRQRVLMAL